MILNTRMTQHQTVLEESWFSFFLILQTIERLSSRTTIGFIIKQKACHGMDGNNWPSLGWRMACRLADLMLNISQLELVWTHILHMLLWSWDLDGEKTRWGWGHLFVRLLNVSFMNVMHLFIKLWQDFFEWTSLLTSSDWMVEDRTPNIENHLASPE